MKVRLLVGRAVTRYRRIDHTTFGVSEERRPDGRVQVSIEFVVPRRSDIRRKKVSKS